MVGDDRERLEGSLRETTGVPAKDVALHLLMEGRVGEEPPAPRDLTKLKASVDYEIGRASCRERV